ncbi:hypothetical protein [Neobacillus sp. FSL H8-0543]|uniref:McrC family protein n=1 Tax=Neobacillus sp. FSL H8-0543 TaxID=2954672 RepID=UPI0031584CCB
MELTETIPKILKLSSKQAEALQFLGYELAEQLAQDKNHIDDEYMSKERSIISCRKISDGNYEVIVRNAIGIIGLGEANIQVNPKIPIDHFLYLFSEATRMPRLASEKAFGESGHNLVDLFILSFLKYVEELVRQGILTTYQTVNEPLPVIRGNVDVRKVIMNYSMGRLLFDCEYDDIIVDHPLNRVIVEALLTISMINDEWKKLATPLLSLFDGVGRLQSTDLTIETDRRSYYYHDALILAKHILHRIGLNLRYGELPIISFLLPTPVVIEAGLRTILTEHLTNETVEKKPYQIGETIQGSLIKVNPDLVFGDGLGVGDVKYKLSKGYWKRQDLYQVTAFAAAAKSKRGLLLNFQDAKTLSLPKVTLGDIEISQCAWNIDSKSPEVAAKNLVKEVHRWITEKG